MIPPDSPSYGSHDEYDLAEFCSVSPIPVQRVGGYLCSIIPGVDDFGRVSKDVFLLPPDIESVLHEHYTKGFSFVVCVFEGDVAAHPIAYSSARLENNQLFIPTRHAHGHGEYSTQCKECGTIPKQDAFWKCVECPSYYVCDACRSNPNTSHSIEHSLMHVARDDGFDHVLYLISCELVTTKKQYTSARKFIPDDKNKLCQLNISPVECFEKVVIEGKYPNGDYYCVEKI